MDIVEHVRRSLQNAEIGISKINSDIINYIGYSGTKTRHLYNNLCSLPNANYLEIGTWYGSSSISALYGNKIQATFIDNWSEFGGNKNILTNAIHKFNTGSLVNVLETDCWKVDLDSLPEYDIYLYDGAHTYDDHYKAITYYASKLKNNCIVIVDDWNWPQVRDGTMKAFSDLGIKFLFKHEIILPESDTVNMPKHKGKETWWNGIGIFVLDK